MADPLDVYRTHSPWSDPGAHAAWLGAIPAEPGAIVRHVSDLLVHCLDARLRGVTIPEKARRDVEVRRVATIAERLRARDDRAATTPRDPATRFFGVCAHFALVATAVFRTHGVPARTRVGFARYFVPNSLEDHWVTEYRDGERWYLLDAQLGDEARQMLGIAFDPWDVPRDQFLDAGTVWRGLRTWTIDPGHVGLTVAGLTGAWFAAQSVLRDAAALASDEMLPWDTWSWGRQVSPFTRDVPAPFAEALSGVAARLAGSPGADEVAAAHREAPWLRRTPSIFTLEFPTGWPDGVPSELAP